MCSTAKQRLSFTFTLRWLCPRAAVPHRNLGLQRGEQESLTVCWSDRRVVEGSSNGLQLVPMDGVQVPDPWGQSVGKL